MKKQLVFSQEEYRERVRRTQERMDHQGLELLLVTDPGHMNYLTGFDGWSFYVHQGLIVSLNDPYPIWFGREQDANAARLTSTLPDDCIFGYPDEYVQSRYSHTMEFVSRLIKDRFGGKSGGRAQTATAGSKAGAKAGPHAELKPRAKSGSKARTLGVEMDGYWFTAKMYIMLMQELSDMKILDAENLVNWVKTIKTPSEIAYIREAAAITKLAMDEAVESIAPGIREKESAARASAQQIRGTETYGGSSPAIFPIMPSAERTSSAHLTYDADRMYRTGDVVLLELGSARYHYHAPLSRTVYLGEPPDDLRRVADVVISGLQDTLSFIAPGVTAEEVEERWRSNLKGTGVEKPSRVGYSFGLNFVPDWGEHTVSLRPGDKTILKPGMTIHFMPGIWLDTYGFENSEPFLVTEEGCEKLIEYPQKLFVKKE